MCETSATANPTTERSGLKKGVDWVGKHWPRVRLGHEGIILDKIQRQQRCVETLARNTMTGDLDNTDGWPGNEGDDAMGVDIGDKQTIHNHYYPRQSTPEPHQPVPKEEPQQQDSQEELKGDEAISSQEKSPGILQKLSPYALAAGVGIGGLGIGWGLGQPKSIVEYPQVTDTGTDTVRKVDVEVWRPNEEVEK